MRCLCESYCAVQKGEVARVCFPLSDCREFFVLPVNFVDECLVPIILRLMFCAARFRFRVPRAEKDAAMASMPPAEKEAAMFDDYVSCCRRCRCRERSFEQGRSPVGAKYWKFVVEKILPSGGQVRFAVA